MRTSDVSSPKNSARPAQTPAIMLSWERNNRLFSFVAMILSVFAVDIEFSGRLLGNDDPEDDVGPDRKSAEKDQQEHQQPDQRQQVTGIFHHVQHIRL